MILSQCFRNIITTENCLKHRNYCNTIVHNTILELGFHELPLWVAFEVIMFFLPFNTVT